MKQESAKHLADGATTLAVSSGASSYYGWFVFINDNASGIGVILSFFFGMIGLVFYWLTWKKSTLAEENKKELNEQSEKLNNHIEESTQQFKKLGNGIDTILDKLS